jgi:hypothetical protein
VSGCSVGSRHGQIGYPCVREWRPRLAFAAHRRREAESRYGERKAEGCISLSAHLCALREAGFAEVGTIWQIHDDRVLLAVR